MAVFHNQPIGVVVVIGAILAVVVVVQLQIALDRQNGAGALAVEEMLQFLMEVVALFLVVVEGGLLVE